MNKFIGSHNEYICIDAETGSGLLDYYNGVLNEQDANAFEDHLFFCYSCQDKFLRLEAIFAALASSAGTGPGRCMRIDTTVGGDPHQVLRKRPRGNDRRTVVLRSQADL